MKWEMKKAFEERSQLSAAERVEQYMKEKSFKGDTASSCTSYTDEGWTQPVSTNAEIKNKEDIVTPSSSKNSSRPLSQRTQKRQEANQQRLIVHLKEHGKEYVGINYYAEEDSVTISTLVHTEAILGIVF